MTESPPAKRQCDSLSNYIDDQTVRNGGAATRGCLFSVKDEVGALRKVLAQFEALGVNLKHLESRPSRKNPGQEYEFYVDMCADGDIETIASSLKELAVEVVVLSQDPESPLGDPTIPWFPQKVADLDKFADRVLSAGSELESDHPGFKDPVYRDRRRYFADIAIKYRYGQPIPRVEYTEEEIATWREVFNKLTGLYPTHACKEHCHVFPLLRENCNYQPDVIPQLEDVSAFLKDCSGFTLRPVAGLLSSRDFLAGLAFRVFHSTQYIRHSSKPLYTPEPDVCHELLGHAPLFADPSFADFSQEMGLASLGAPDDWVKKLATLYWFTIEFGLCRQKGQVKAYGAGLLSSFGELEYCVTDKPEVRPFEPEKACTVEYPITTYQPTYFISDSFEEAKEKMRKFAATIPRKFSIHYNPYTQRMEVINKPEQLQRIADAARSEMNSLYDAIAKVC